MKPADHKIYLASKSPRRRELLRQIGVEFELLLLRDQGPRGPEVSEAVQEGEAPADYVARVAMEKGMFAKDVMAKRKLPVRPVLSADTSVVLDGRIFGKPAEPKEAADMLRALSGKTHQVMTGISLHRDDESWQIMHVSEVMFAQLDEQAIKAYCATQEPYDKAGGYGIQGAAAVFIERIAGSHSGIMGLPLFETSQLLKKAGIQVL